VFVKRRKEAEAAASQKGAEAACGRPAVPVARHLGEVWHVLQSIAEEEDARFKEKSIVEHFNASAEGARDVDRWLHIYQRRVDPRHEFAFPAHWRRHQGYALVPRNWPEGILWEAFDETTWFRAPFPPARTEEELIALVDARVRPPARE